VIIRTAANKQEIEQAIEAMWANDPPKEEYKAGDLAHWLALFASDPQGFWIAEDEDTQQIVGAATSNRRPPQWILTNFFVLPEYHGQGIGKMMLAQAFANREGCERFLVHSSTHPSAQMLYMQLGMYPLPHSIHFKGRSRNQPPQSSVAIEPYPVADILSTLNTFDESALGFTRAVDHQRWGKSGSYFLVEAAGNIVGYFRVSSEPMLGPLVVSDARWTIPALEHAFWKQSELSPDEFEVFVPGANRAALEYLLACGYRYHEIDLLMSSHPMPGLAQVIFRDTDFL